MNLDGDISLLCVDILRLVSSNEYIFLHFIAFLTNFFTIDLTSSLALFTVSDVQPICKFSLHNSFYSLP